MSPRRPRMCGSAAARQPAKSRSATGPTIRSDRDSPSALAFAVHLRRNRALRRCAARAGSAASRLAGLGVLFALSGCGTLSSINPFSSSGGETAAACPTSTILRPLAQTAVFGKPGPGLRPTDVAFYGILSEVDAKCANQAGALHASLDVIVAAERGPANKSGDV